MKSRLASMLVLVGLTACGGAPVAQVSASPQASASPAQQLGPGGLTLDEEIGAVMMAGFVGPLTKFSARRLDEAPVRRPADRQPQPQRSIGLRSEPPHPTAPRDRATSIVGRYRPGGRWGLHRDRLCSV